MIIFIFGEDTFRGSKKIKELQRSFLEKKGGGEDSLSFLNGAEASLGEINEKASASSLFSSGNKRMIILENSFANPQLKEISEYFEGKEKKEEDNVIIFSEPRVKTKKKRAKTQTVFLDSAGWEKPLTKKQQEWLQFLKKSQFSQEFALLSNTQATQWARGEVKARGGEISNRALELLISLVGNNLWQLNGEIDKLVNYKKNEKEKTIEVEDVEELVEGLFDQDIFALTDAISNQSKDVAIRLLEKQYFAGVNEHYLLNMIIRQVKILTQIRQALDSGHTSRKINSELGLHPFVVQKGINQVRKFRLDSLKKALNKLVEIDYFLKSGQGEAKILLDLFVLKI